MRARWLFALALYLALSPARAESGFQSQVSILAAIDGRVASEFRRRGLDYQAEVLPLDPRLRLADCGRPLEAAFPQGFREGGGYLTVGVRCAGAQPWTVYAKVKVAVYREVLVLRNALRRGGIVGPEDVALERRNLALLGGDYLTAPGQAVGKPVARGLPAGLVLGAGQLSIPKTIRGGEPVTIRVEGEGYEIGMSGQALADGELGQRIRVRNQQSGRVVVGTVAGPGRVIVDR